MIKKKLKILNFETGKPETGYDDLQRRLMELSNNIHNNPPPPPGTWMITGQRVADELASLVGEVYGPGLDNYGREPLMASEPRLLGVDMVDNDPTQLSLRMLVEPHRVTEHVNIDFTITPTGDTEEEE